MALLQTGRQGRRRAAALRILAEAGKHVRDPGFAALQVRVRSAVFDKVVKDIQAMVDKLVAEQKAEVELRDFCIQEFQKNELATEQGERDKADLTAKVEDLESSIAALTSEI